MILRRLLARLRREERGMVLVETAFALSVLSFTTLAGVEIGRFVLLTQKLDRAAASVADMAAQGSTISVGDLNNLFSAAGEIVKPSPSRVTEP
jgi:Flp pilus assembly protein TadG